MSYKNAEYTNAEHTELKAELIVHEDAEPVSFSFGIHPDSRVWRQIMAQGIPIVDFVTPFVDNSPSFYDDIIDALTGTPDEQTAAKARLKSRKL